MGIEFLLRILGMIVFAIIGWQIGASLGAGPDTLRYVIVLVLAGAALGCWLHR